jgi:hypothetical protein
MEQEQNPKKTDLDGAWPFIKHSIKIAACVIGVTFENFIFEWCIKLGLPGWHALIIEIAMIVGLSILMIIFIIELIIEGHNYLKDRRK